MLNKQPDTSVTLSTVQVKTKDGVLNIKMSISNFTPSVSFTNLPKNSRTFGHNKAIYFVKDTDGFFKEIEHIPNEVVARFNLHYAKPLARQRACLLVNGGAAGLTNYSPTPNFYFPVILTGEKKLIHDEVYFEVVIGFITEWALSSSISYDPKHVEKAWG